MIKWLSGRALPWPELTLKVTHDITEYNISYALFRNIGEVLYY